MSTHTPQQGALTGPSWATVVLGLLALVAGALLLGSQLVDIDVDWSVAAPAVFVGSGVLLVLLGLLALARRRPGPQDPV